MNYTINLRRAFSEVFGIVGYLPLGAKRPPLTEKLDYQVQGEIIHGEVKKISFLGTPIYESVAIKGNPDYMFPDAMIYDLGQASKIIKTEITKRDGTVKEYISLDDYKITFNGFIINNQSDVYPSDQVQKFVELFKKGSEHEIVSDILNSVFGIHNIVVDDRQFVRIRGNPSVQPFVLTCSSDEPIEFVLDANGDFIIFNS